MSYLVHRRLRAPQDDSAALIDPPIAEVQTIIERNRHISEQFARQPELPSNFRTLARAILVLNAALRRGVNLSNEQVKAETNRPIILTGHQPELFHPGVWFKNFLASTIAQQVGGYAVNLVIDNDIIRSVGIKVPTRSRAAPHVVEVPFDAPAAAVPWEDRRILDNDVFKRFTAEVHGAFEPVVGSPGGQPIILDHLWPYAIEEMESENRHGRETIARFTKEQGLEMPQTQI